MSDDKRARGIVDPWRKVEPLRPPSRPSAQPARARIDLDALDRDADLAVPGQYTLRSAHACFAITSPRVATPADALEVLADCMLALCAHKPTMGLLVGTGIGVRCHARAYNEPAPRTAAAKLQGGGATFWFVDRTLDEGLQVLAKCVRVPVAAPTLRRFGVVVMLTAS